jgi:hypothetical protein
MDGCRSSKQRQNVTWQSVSRGASAEMWAEHVKPIITPYALKDIFNLDETAHFIMYNRRRIWHEGQEVSGRERV